MLHFGGKLKKTSSDSKRHFTVIIEKGKTKNNPKEHGLYVSSTPLSAARKVVTKLCASKKGNKVEFHIREITQGSKKKTYGPYVGYLEKLKDPIELKGRVIKYKPVVKLSKKISSKINLSGGMSLHELESKLSDTLLYYKNIENNKDLILDSHLTRWILPLCNFSNSGGATITENYPYVIVRLQKRGWFSAKDEKTYIAFYITPAEWLSESDFFYLTLLAKGDGLQNFMKNLLQNKIYKSNRRVLVQTIINARDLKILPNHADFIKLQEYFEKNSTIIYQSELFTNTNTTDTSNRNSSNIQIIYDEILEELRLKLNELDTKEKEYKIGEEPKKFFQKIITAFQDLMNAYNEYGDKTNVLEKFNFLRNIIQLTPEQIRRDIGGKIFTELINFLTITFYDDKSRIWVLEELRISDKLDLRSLPPIVFQSLFLK